MRNGKTNIIKSLVFLLILGSFLLLAKHIELNAETNPRDGFNGNSTTTTTTTALYSTTTTTTALVLELSTTTTTTTTTALALSSTTTTTTAIPSFSKQITYTLPYLHTNPNNVVYCEVSNGTSSYTIGSLTVLSNSGTNKPLQTAETTGLSVSSKQTAMITFTGSSVTLGSTTVDITTNTDNTGANSQAIFYSAKISFGTDDTTATCDTIGMTCFQGTTTPRRNLIGYLCFDTIYYAH